MNEALEILLKGWGQERLEPSIEVSIRSPLGQVHMGGSAIGGSQGLSTVETWVAQSRAVLAVEQALRDLVGEQGASGRVLLQLAEVRYARHPPMKLVDQRRVLAISRNTYRARVDLLHVEVAARLPAIVDQLMRLSAGMQAAQAREEWLRKVRKAQARAAKAKTVQQAARAA